MNAAEISRSGLDVEWQRLQVIAENLANVNTSRTAGGAPYRAMRLLSGPTSSFDATVDGKHAMQPEKVQVLGMEPEGNGVRRVYDPQNPEAGADGFVTYPQIDHAGEMMLMIQTSRAYEADLAALNIAHQMYARALDLGKQS